MMARASSIYIYICIYVCVFLHLMYNTQITLFFSLFRCFPLATLALFFFLGWGKCGTCETLQFNVNNLLSKAPFRSSAVIVERGRPIHTCVEKPLFFYL